MNSIKKYLVLLIACCAGILVLNKPVMANSFKDATPGMPCRISAIGDSITYSYSYADYFNNQPQYTVKNFARCGTQVAGEYEESFVKRTLNLTTESDIILIMGGTNDFCGYNYIYNPIGSVSDFRIDTFCGAYNMMIHNLRLANPMSKIVILTPIKRYDGMNVNPAGSNIVNYVEAVKAVAAKNELLCIDLYNNPACDFIASGQLTDGLHPSVTGQQIMGGQIQSALIAAGY